MISSQYKPARIAGPSTFRKARESISCLLGRRVGTTSMRGCSGRYGRQQQLRRRHLPLGTDPAKGPAPTYHYRKSTSRQQQATTVSVFLRSSSVKFDESGCPVTIVRATINTRQRAAWARNTVFRPPDGSALPTSRHVGGRGQLNNLSVA